MKIRNGFVSNSSSSSFQCDYCHRFEIDESGETSMYEWGFIECDEGHSICVDHLSPEVQRKVERMAADDEDFQYEPRIHSDDCPMCQLQVIRDSQLVEYFLQKLGKSRDEVISDIRDAVGNLDAFQTHLSRREPLPEPPAPLPAGHRPLDLD